MKIKSTAREILQHLIDRVNVIDALTRFWARITRATTPFDRRGKQAANLCDPLRARLGVELLEDRRTPSTLITTVPYVITAPGTYQLASNLYYGAVAGSAITVRAEGVLINFNGHKLWSATGAATTAVGISSIQESRITIENGVIQGFQFGIQVAGESSYGNQVHNMVLDNNWYVGLWMDGTATLVENNIVENTGGCDIPGYTIAIGMHVAGPGSTVLDNRITGLIWYPGVTQEVVALGLDDAPNAVVMGNVIKQSKYTTNSWGLWINSVDNDESTTVNLENNSFANFQYASTFDYSQGQVENNHYFDVAIQWNASTVSAVTDLGGNIGLPVMGFSPGEQNITAQGFADSSQARTSSLNQGHHSYSLGNITPNALWSNDKWSMGTNEFSFGRYSDAEFIDGALSSPLDAGQSNMDASLDSPDSGTSSLVPNGTAANVLAPPLPSAGNRPTGSAQAPFGNSPILPPSPLPAIAFIPNHFDLDSYSNDLGRDDKIVAGRDLFQNNSWNNVLPGDVLAPWFSGSWNSTQDRAESPDAPKSSQPVAEQPENPPQVRDNVGDPEDGAPDDFGDEV